MKYQSLNQIKEAGFAGFTTVENLYNMGYSSIPCQEGVYMILRLSDSAPKFVANGTGGFYRGENPNVGIEELKANWVNGTCVMYIGESTDIRKRIRQYMAFGHGRNIGHKGGRYIWQLADCKDLIVCWKPTSGDSRTEEGTLIQDFKLQYGARPFANLRD